MPRTAASRHSPSSGESAWHLAPMAHAGGACPASAAFCCAARICCATCSQRWNPLRHKLLSPEAEQMVQRIHPGLELGLG